MNTQLPGNLAEIFPLRLRLREEMRFQRADGHVVTERVRDLQRFSLRYWQYEMMRRLDGRETFEEVAREVYGQFRGQFTSVGLLNFYRWLYHENLILCECDSIFELVEGETESPSKEDVSLTSFAGHHSLRMASASAVDRVIDKLSPRKQWQQQALKISAMILFSLAVLRLAYVIAPVFEPPVNRLYAGLENYFYDSVQPTSVEGSSPEIPESPAKEMELAARVSPEEIEEIPEPAPQLQPEPVAVPDPEFDPVQLDSLRRRLAECRIRRDEFYIQNDEQGYREEVARMLELAQEIGELESRL